MIGEEVDGKGDTSQPKLKLGKHEGDDALLGVRGCVFTGKIGVEKGKRYENNRGSGGGEDTLLEPCPAGRLKPRLR